jgi:predicted HAD superfamily phosphohydrolase YqeG
VQVLQTRSPHFRARIGTGGTSAHETMYIGDNYYADIVGSHRAGLTPVLYDPITLFPDVECDVINPSMNCPTLLK